MPTDRFEHESGGEMKSLSHIISFGLAILLVGVTVPQAFAAKQKLKSSTAVASVPNASVPDIQFAQAVVERDGKLQIINTATCDSSPDSACMRQCHGTVCEWSEPPCRDCIGTGSPVIRDIFTNLSNVYRATQPIDNETVVKDLIKKTISMNPKSPYDFYNKSDEPGMGPHLQILCGSTTGFVGVMYDEDNRPTRAVLAVCTTATGIRAMVLERIDENQNRKPFKPIQITPEIELRKP